MVPKPKIDKLILNYFIQEGFQEAAISFANEIGIDMASPSTTAVTSGYSTITQRKQIKQLILLGHITDAISKISEYFPSILDSNNLLHFKLLRLNLIEMIRSHQLHNSDGDQDFLPVILLFIREHLIPKVLLLYKLLHELEVTLLLLCFRYDPLLDGVKDLPVELRGLFDLSLRTQCYRLVNRAILLLKETCEYRGPPFSVVDVDMVAEGPPVDYIDDDPVDIYVGDEEMSEEDHPDDEEEDEPEEINSALLELKLERVAKLWAITMVRMSEFHIRREIKPLPEVAT